MLTSKSTLNLNFSLLLVRVEVRVTVKIVWEMTCKRQFVSLPIIRHAATLAYQSVTRDLILTNQTLSCS